VTEEVVLDGQATKRAMIHIPFAKIDGAWAPKPTSPSAISWSVCFDGRSLGPLNTGLPQSENVPGWLRWAHVPVQGQVVPFVGKRTREFTGWMGGEVFRPLVLTSGGRCADPDGWRPEVPSPAVIAKLIPAMREATKEIYDCGKDGGRLPYSFPDAAILPGKSYVSRNGARIVQLSVRMPESLLHRCEIIEGPGWQPHTFGVLPDGEVAHLGHGLQLIDAGDYDGDGRSEVIFLFGGYNRGGYVLVHDSLSQSLRYEWSYH